MWAQVAAALLVLGVSAGIANLDIRYDANGLSVRTGWSPPSRDARVGEPGPPSRETRVGEPGQRPTPTSSGTARAPALVTSTDAAPWRADLAALERQLKNELHATQAAGAGMPGSAPALRAISASDADVLRRVRALVDESEKRQQRELALRVAEVLRDVSSQRQADLAKIDRSLGVVQNNLGVEVMKQRQSLNLLYRASQRQ